MRFVHLVRIRICGIYGIFRIITARASSSGRRLSIFSLAWFPVMVKSARRAKWNPENPDNPINPDSDKPARNCA